MNSLERARQFLSQKASRLALAIVPLAALAISTPSAKAGSITATSGSFATIPDGCAVSGTGATGSCATIWEGPVGGNSNINWVAMAGNGSTDGTLTFTDGNSGSGTLPAGSVPVSWLFDVNNLAVQDPTVNWTVTFSINTGSGSISFSQSGSASTGSVVSGSGSIDNPSLTELFTWSMSLSTAPSGGSFPYSIVIPGLATMDLNPVSSVPEPASLLLIAPGLGALLYLRRRKRQSEKNS